MSFFTVKFLLFNFFQTFVVNKLKNYLRQEAPKKCSFVEKISLGSLETAYKNVPLQIDQYQPNRDSDETGHQHTRKEIIERNKNLIMCISPKDFFQRSQEHIRGTPDYKNARTKEAKEKILEEKGNVVGVIGQAGVGKSTLLKDLFYRNVAGERLYKADFVFHVKLRDFFDKTEINLFQFLMEKSKYDAFEWMKNSLVRKGVLKLLSESKSVCILLDGLDEAGIDVTHLKKQSKIDFDINSVNSPEHFILGLLSGQILPKAKKIITSRPGQMLDLPEIYKPKFILNIFGIKQEDIKQFCHDICGVEHASEILSRIESQPDLLSYCLVPINCVLIVNCFNNLKEKKHQKFSPNNITDIFVSTFFYFSKIENERENCKKFGIKSFTDLEKISKLAWTGIKDQKQYFDEKDLNAAGLNETDISSFTVACKRSNEETRIAVLENATKKYIYFSHLLLQEFFAAVFCIFFMSFPEFEATFCDSNQFSLADNRFEMISTFMFGLFNLETIEILKEIYPDTFRLNKHMKRLTDFTTDSVSTMSEAAGSRTNNLTFLRVCRWAYETQNLEFCEKLAESFPLNFDLFFDDDLLASDILPLCYVIKARKKILELRIFASSSNINAIKNLHLFCKEMECILKNSSHIKVNHFYPKLF